MNRDPLEYYRIQGPMTDPGDEGGCLGGIPTEVAGLRDIVQGLVIHVFWTERYGVRVPPERKRELQMRGMKEKLAQVRLLDGSPITTARPPDRRILGNCRDVSLMLCSMLRHLGKPARARCGFATYFAPNHFEDHWVCEYWGKEGRWVKVDAQLDALQREKLGIDFDPLDVPPDRFLAGGKAWQMCRTGGADPDSFGISDMHGLWFVRGNLVRDLASLNKVELLPWDAWGLMDSTSTSAPESDLALLDHVADATQAGNDRFAEVRSLFNDERLRVPLKIRSYTAAGPLEVDVGRTETG